MTAFASHPTPLAAPVRLALVRSFNASVAMAWLVAAAASAATEPTREHQIKAAALGTIISYTDWPATAFSSADTPLVVGVLGHGPIAVLLDQFLSNETWHGRSVTLRQLASPVEARSCHVLFVAQSESRRWRTVSSPFARLPILTVSDGEDFVRSGGVVQLGIQDNKLRLIVNLGVARTAGLSFSSKLLRLAEVIDDRDP